MPYILLKTEDWLFSCTVAEFYFGLPKTISILHSWVATSLPDKTPWAGASSGVSEEKGAEIADGRLMCLESCSFP